MCDDNCPQYKSAKIHTVAAADHNNLLNGFIASYRKVKASPNLTKLATAGMPKGRAHKGNKPPAKKRPPISIETRIDPNPISTSALPDFDSGLPRSDYNVQVNPSYQQSLSAPLSVTIGSSFVPMPPPYGLPYPPPSQYCPSLPTAPGPSSPYPPMPTRLASSSPYASSYYGSSSPYGSSYRHLMYPLHPLHLTHQCLQCLDHHHNMGWIQVMVVYILFVFTSLVAISAFVMVARGSTRS